MDKEIFSLYHTFCREEWSKLCFIDPLPFTENDLIGIKEIHEPISLDELSNIYLPMVRIINLYIDRSKKDDALERTLKACIIEKVPYVIGIAGKVGVGKSTTARILQTLLSKWVIHQKVNIINADNFLSSNEILENKGQIGRKGFQKSYDDQSLIKFLKEMKDQYKAIEKPDILIVEGMNVLQTTNQTKQQSKLQISDLCNFTIYIDAKKEHIEKWFKERFNRMKENADSVESNNGHRYSRLSKELVNQIAEKKWLEINEKNLNDNPSLLSAQLVIEKEYDHSAQLVRLRKF